MAAHEQHMRGALGAAVSPLGGAPTISDAVAHQAATWFFLLRSSDASERDRQCWMHWLDADPAHAMAWQKALRVGRTFEQLPPEVARPVLDRAAQGSRMPRRTAIQALALLLTAAPAGWLAWRHTPAHDWLAEHRTATGERRDIWLADGSRLQLDTASAVDIDFNGPWRQIRLRSGAIHIETAPDPQTPPRPLVVDTAQGRLRALGTRFTVRQAVGHTRIAVFEGAVEARPAAAPDQVAVLQAGRQARMTRAVVEPARAAEPLADSWTRGILHVREMRLQDFAAELARYRPGIVRCDPAVADLRISGTFQLRDTTPVLDSLPQALPVTVVYRTPYWVTLVAPGG